MTTNTSTIEINNNATETSTVNGLNAHQKGGEPGTGSNSIPKENSGENGGTPEQTPKEAKKKKRTRASLTISSLNMKGRGSTAPLHRNNKWNSIHHFIKERRIAILAVQETHTDDNLAEQLSVMYGRRLAIFNSASDNPTASAGVALIVNKDLVNADHATATEIIPGRVILLEIPWHQTLTLKILNVYAPNAPKENTNFWAELNVTWTSTNLPNPDILLGDFNMVEDAMDRMPQRPDEFQTTEALGRLTRRFGLHDGWRKTNPDELNFSFPVFQRSSRSRLGRIYASNKLVKLADNWLIETSQINTDHKMVSAQFTDRKAPFIGPGRWAMPLELLNDDEFMGKAKGMVVELKKATCDSIRIRTASLNPQTLFTNFKNKLVEAARVRMKTKIPKVKKALEALKKDLEELRAKPDAITAEDIQRNMRLIEERIAHLEKMSNQSRRLATTARNRLEGETISKYWTAIKIGRTPRDLVYSLAIPDTFPKTFERRSNRMANIRKIHPSSRELCSTKQDYPLLYYAIWGPPPL